MKSNVSNDRLAQVAQDAYHEANWEMFPSEAQEQLEYSAQFNIDEWLRSGRTDQFSWF